MHLLDGGTLEIDSPRPYGAVAAGLLTTLGIDVAALAKTSHRPKYYEQLGLHAGVFFDQETFGADKLVVGMDRVKDQLSRMSCENFLKDLVKAEPAASSFMREPWANGVWARMPCRRAIRNWQAFERLNLSRVWYALRASRVFPNTRRIAQSPYAHRLNTIRCSIPRYPRRSVRMSLVVPASAASSTPTLTRAAAYPIANSAIKSGAPRCQGIAGQLTKIAFIPVKLT
jgi:hypothetical protein